MSRVNIERWEAGSSRPFYGHTVSLLSVLRPLVVDKLSAGQLLGVAAAAVCPELAAPTRIYTGEEIASLLVDGSDDQRDLAPPLLQAFAACEFMMPLDGEGDYRTERYISVVGASAVDRRSRAWELQVLAVADRLAAADRDLWLDLGRRLAGTGSDSQKGGSEAPRAPGSVGTAT
jgi:hypothetical protein